MEKVKTIKCHHCKYIWQTKSKKQNVVCPDCLYKVNIAKNKIEEKQEDVIEQ